MRDVTTVEHDDAARRIDEASDGFEERRLAGAVGAEQRDDFAAPNLEVDAEQHLHAVVGNGDALALQQRVVLLTRAALGADARDERQRVQGRLRIAGNVFLGRRKDEPADYPVGRRREQTPADAVVVGDARDRKDDEQHPDAGDEEQERPGERQRPHPGRRHERLGEDERRREHAAYERRDQAERNHAREVGHRAEDRDEHTDADEREARPLDRLAEVLASKNLRPATGDDQSRETGGTIGGDDDAATELTDADHLVQEDRHIERERDVARADEEERAELTAQRRHREEGATSLAERDRRLARSDLGGIRVVGRTAGRLAQPQ